MAAATTMLAPTTACNDTEKALKPTHVLTKFWGTQDGSEHPRVSEKGASVNLFYLV